MNTHFVEVDGFDSEGYFGKVGYIEDGKRVFDNNLNAPTHFIEVFRHKSGVTVTQKPYEISLLDSSLALTKEWGNTIAIFKIRPRH